MPPRIARSSVATSAPKSAKNKSRKRNLDAYSIAAHSIKPSRRDGVPKHRLGEVEDSGPSTKRRRNDDDEDRDGDDSEEDVPKKKAKGSGMMGEDGDGVEEGEDSEGNEWTMGGLREGESESDLDSEEAFGSSDEERFEGFTFRGSSTVKKGKKPVRKRAAREEGEGEVDLNEDEPEEDEGEEESDDFGDEGVDLATMLDGDNASDPGDDDDDDGSGSGSSNGDDDDDANSESESDFEADDAEGEEERIARMRDRIDTLTTRDRPTTTTPTDEPADENGLLPMDDLYADIMADLNPEEKKQHLIASLKKKTKSKIPKALTAPLPKRQQDKMDRGVASAKAKEQLDRWLPTVKHNREAEFLTFPLVDPGSESRVGRDKFVLSGEQPRNELERELLRIREESGMAAPRSKGEGGKVEDEEDQLIRAEELAVREMPVEEVMRRRAELRMRRDLLFREERKAKRVAKIKSKSYRRVHRRERAANEAKEAEMNEGLPENEDEREKSDRKRAEQRMSTKHNDSKFAKSMKATNRTVWDEGARDGVNEAARRQEELKRRIAGEDVGDEDDGSDASDVSSDGGGSDEEERGMLRRLNKLREEGRGIGSQKGVGGMKFMREAEERLRKRNEEDVERLRKELAVADGEEGEESDEQEGRLGRAIFGPRAKEGAKLVEKKKRGELEEGSEDEDESAWKGFGEEDGVVERGGVRDAKAVAKGILKKPGSNGSGPLAATRDRRDPEASKVAAGRDDGEEGVSSWVVGGDEEEEEVESAERTADAVDESGPMAAAADAPNSKRKGKISLGAVLESEVNDEEPNTTSVSAGATEGWQTIPATNDSENESADSDSDADTKPVLTAAEQKSAFHRRAFAGDDVELAFSAEKAADAAEEDVQESSNYMPGWGSWAGTGLSKSIRKSNTKAAHNPLFKTRLPGGGVGMDQRRDKGKANVIVSEKMERKGKKYLAPVLPHGFGRKEEYEGSLRVPVGPEWSTKEVFQRGTRPRVVVRPGGVVGAMERPMM
ncbi:hypothetical protein LTR17_021924 [Elasticomyces elasticus]|nr:hypothetical protein LTR17_021924 [Elasticomyces elasticus]